jgi:peptide/nickel transport system ATP-binding protein
MRREHIRLAGETPSPINLPKGWRFAGRCPRKIGAICDTVPPPQRLAVDQHMIACHIPVDELRKLAPIFAQAFQHEQHASAERRSMGGIRDGS